MWDVTPEKIAVGVFTIIALCGAIGSNIRWQSFIDGVDVSFADLRINERKLRFRRCLMGLIVFEMILAVALALMTFRLSSGHPIRYFTAMMGVVWIVANCGFYATLCRDISHLNYVLDRLRSVTK